MSRTPRVAIAVVVALLAAGAVTAAILGVLNWAPAGLLVSFGTLGIIKLLESGVRPDSSRPAEGRNA